MSNTTLDMQTIDNYNDSTTSLSPFFTTSIVNTTAIPQLTCNYIDCIWQCTQIVSGIRVVPAQQRHRTVPGSFGCYYCYSSTGMAASCCMRGDCETLRGSSDSDTDSCVNCGSEDRDKRDDREERDKREECGSESIISAGGYGEKSGYGFRKQPIKRFKRSLLSSGCGYGETRYAAKGLHTAITAITAV